MSSEESYRAILRYLTDERQPYAPGTPGNDKRKIRKAAACYVARGGTLYYQRRQRGRQRFCELEVVLPPSRRRGLIRAAHQPAPGARHRTRRHTWQQLSQRYWWRGILKEVKDYIKQCDTCQEKNDRARPPSDPSDMLEELGIEVQTCGDSNDTDEELSNRSSVVPSVPKSTKTRLIEKHELVFVDSKGSVKQASSKHSHAVLTQLNQQRLANQFCDVTLLIEGEEYKAHKSVLAASSDYFRELFIEKGAVSSHEAVVDLSGFCKSSFLPLLEFAYTSVLTFDFCSMAEVAMLARHLFMSEVLEICEHVHKQMESKQLTVYQKGGTHTVESSKSLLDENGDAIPVFTQEVVHTESQKAVNGQALHMDSEIRESPSYEAELITQQNTEILDQPTVDSKLKTVDADSNEHQSPPVDSSADLHVLLVQPDVHARAVRSVDINVLRFHPDSQSSKNGHAGSLCCIHSDIQQSVTSPVPSNGLLAQSALEPSAGTSTKIDVSSLLPDLQQNMISASEICDVNSDLQSNVSNPIETNASSVQHDEEQSMGIPEYINVATELPSTADITEEVDTYVVHPEITQTIPTEVNVSVPAVVPENVLNPVGVIASKIHSVPQNTLPISTDLSVSHPETSDVGVDSCSPTNHSTSVNLSTKGMDEVEKMPTRKLGSSSDALCMDTCTDSLDSSPEADDTYKSRLRQRSVGEGGYIHLHQGLERKLQNRKTNPKSAVQQVAMKLVQRGRKLKLPKRERAETQEEHECSECGLIFQRRYALIMHTLKHERTKEYKCPLCKKEFQYSASLRAHLIRHAHRSEEPALLANTPDGPAAETTKGRTKREFICDICGRTLPKLYSLRIHMLKHTGVKPHACKVCGKTFTYKHGLKMHRILHEINKQFKCDLCEKSFVTKRSLQEHTSLHTGESKYLCSICGKSFHRASGLSKHIKKHQPKPETRRFQCTQCDKSFFEARDLRQHMNKHLGVKPFQCQFCGKCYSWKKDWYSHVKSHSVTDPYRCNVCGKEFFEKALFRRHVKKATHGKKGRAKQNLQRVCEHCGRKFTQLREFRRHMNNHEGVKPFECLTCGVAWADARSLKRHVRTHTGERPYVCPVCHDAHIDARTLRKHMTKYHGDYVPCKIMLEKDTLQFHNQGTQVEHAISIISTDVQEQESEVVPDDVETVLVTGGEPLETIETVTGTEDCSAVSTLSDQSIMQVVNYVLAQQQGQKVEVSETVETVEVEVAQDSDTE